MIGHGFTGDWSMTKSQSDAIVLEAGRGGIELNVEYRRMVDETAARITASSEEDSWQIRDHRDRPPHRSGDLFATSTPAPARSGRP